MLWKVSSTKCLSICSGLNVFMLSGLKRICLHFDEIVVTDCTGSCQLPVQSMTKISSNDDIFVLVWIRASDVPQTWDRCSQAQVTREYDQLNRPFGIYSVSLPGRCLYIARKYNLFTEPRKTCDNVPEVGWNRSDALLILGRLLVRYWHIMKCCESFGGL